MGGDGVGFIVGGFWIVLDGLEFSKTIVTLFKTPVTLESIE